MIIIIFLMGIIRRKDMGIIIIIFIREVMEEEEGLIEGLVIEVDIVIIIIVGIILIMGILVIVNVGEKILID